MGKAAGPQHTFSPSSSSRWPSAPPDAGRAERSLSPPSRNARRRGRLCDCQRRSTEIRWLQTSINTPSHARLIGIDAPGPRDERKDVQKRPRFPTLRREAASGYEGLCRVRRPSADQRPVRENPRHLYRFPGPPSHQPEIVKRAMHPLSTAWHCKYHDEYKAAEAEARAAQKGIWAPHDMGRRRRSSSRTPEMDPRLP